MKASDYATLKEKVVSLEAGLQAIGLAQVGETMGEDSYG